MTSTVYYQSNYNQFTKHHLHIKIQLNRNEKNASFSERRTFKHSKLKRKKSEQLFLQPTEITFIDISTKS